MTIAFDAKSNSTAGTGDLSWTHTPVGTPKGVLVFIVANGTLSDQVTAVTYGGVAMTEVAGSPAAFDSTVDSVVYGYFLGSGIPIVAQTVAVSASGATKIAACMTVTADGNTAVVDTTHVTDSGAPSGTLTLGSVTSWCALAGQCDASAASNVSPLSSWTSVLEHDFGSECAVFYRYDTIAATDVTIGWTDGSGPEPGNCLGVALRESAAGRSSAVVIV